ncbi:MAG: hypothetical protein ACTSSN_02935 [Candidatus Heimdallarchaeaceae archaeon]
MKYNVMTTYKILLFVLNMYNFPLMIHK